jgi:hypothetical protein
MGKRFFVVSMVMIAAGNRQRHALREANETTTT